MSHLRIGLVQSETVDGSPWETWKHVREALAGAPEADLYLLPELWSSGYAHDQWEQIATHSTPGLRESLILESRQRQAWIGGTLISRNAQARLVNRFWLFGPDGEICCYDKGHLFPPLNEPDLLVAGDKRVRVSIAGWQCALSICFDLRFPEMYRLDALEGTEAFLISAAWPAERAATLRLLAQARAIENQAFVVLCNRTGIAQDGMLFGGGSVVVAPDGQIVVDAGDGPCVSTAMLDRDALTASRARMALLDLRRPGLDWAEEPSLFASTGARQVIS